MKKRDYKNLRVRLGTRKEKQNYFIRGRGLVEKGCKIRRERGEKKLGRKGGGGICYKKGKVKKRGGACRREAMHRPKTTRIRKKTRERGRAPRFSKDDRRENEPVDRNAAGERGDALVGKEKGPKVD